MAATLLSIQVSLPREVSYRGRIVTTGIFKESVRGPVMLRETNLDGDAQADRSVHGGRSRAISVYPVEHYGAWEGELGSGNLPHGSFGENFTTRGLLEDGVHIGDAFRVGEAEIVVTQPRMPCFKLALRFQRDDMPDLFGARRRHGFYLGVLKEGLVEAGCPVEPIRRDEAGLSVAEVARLRDGKGEELEVLERVVRIEALSAEWRDHFARRIQELSC